MLEYVLAFIIGLSLGLMGGGGSILTVPVLVYVSEKTAKEAIAMGLGIVGLAALVGVISHARKKNINFRIALFFGGVAMLGALAGVEISQLMSGGTQLILFAIVMIAASIFMMRGRQELEGESLAQMTLVDYLWIALQAFCVGVMTGVVGVGGGFLIVPALVLLVKIPMKKAVGSSLLIISMNSLVGFASASSKVTIDWNFFVNFSLLTSAGIILGSYLVHYVPTAKLKKGFAYFLILMGSFILYQNRAALLL